jgi:hypothetical protein
VGLCYARIVWPRIPFAAANLKTALTAVKDNMGLVVATLFSTYTSTCLQGFNLLTAVNVPMLGSVGSGLCLDRIVHHGRQ